jgi:hypothetical protein
MKALMAALADINGQDAYDGLVAGMGKVNRANYLKIPVGMPRLNIAPGVVGQVAAHAGLDHMWWARIYFVNRDAAPSDVGREKFALLRLEAVKAGWLTSDSTYEVEEVDFPDDATVLTQMNTDAPALTSNLQSARSLGFLLPLVAEHVFRTMGHHFISDDAPNYLTRYQSTFRACLMPDLANYLEPSVLFHTALHWVSPGRAWQVLQAQKGTQHLPDAISIRANAPPAGTAIITTTAAVIDALEAANIANQFTQYGGFDLQSIRNMTDTIKLNPPRYHKAWFAYNVVGLTPAETDALEAVKAVAIRFAPYSQAFISAYLRQADLGRAKALRKHAEQNPIQMKLARNLFNAFAKAQPKNIPDLFTAHFDAETLADAQT